MEWEVKKARLCGQLELTKDLEKYYQKVSLVVEKGFGLSNQSYEKFQQTNLELLEVAKQRAQNRGMSVFFWVGKIFAESQQPLPKILTEYQDILLPLVNQQVLSTAGDIWSQKINWTELATKCVNNFQSNSELSIWLKNNSKRGTHLKSLYLKQLTFDENWNQIVANKGGYKKMLFGMTNWLKYWHSSWLATFAWTQPSSSATCTLFGAQIIWESPQYWEADSKVPSSCM